MEFKVFIGLEIHIELKTKAKMFCRCAADYFGHEPNTHVCPVCLGLPGALPVPNKKAIELTIMVGQALNCQINSFSKFDRKNYFYPDLPKGYQISQYDLPLCQKGEFEGIKITRVHLEEDTGKLIHEIANNQKVSLIDFNRSGIPLMEIVTEPDLRSTTQAKDFLKKLQQLVRCLGVADADMEKGQMRCEPTVNLEIVKNKRKYYTPLVEIKNINSFRFAEKAIEYEIKRQLEEFEKTGLEKQAGNKTTRGWDEKRQKTVLQREKEEAADYRYFPEPDIPPIRLTDSQIKALKSKVPELPGVKIIRFMNQYGLSREAAINLIRTNIRADEFEKKINEAKKYGLSLQEIKINELASWIGGKKFNQKKKLKEIPVIFIVRAKKDYKLPKEKVIKTVNLVIDNNQKIVEEIKKGKETAIEFLVGQVMKETKGQVDPNHARSILREKIKSA